jgi:iron complex outermembrane recepter protein
MIDRNQKEGLSQLVIVGSAIGALLCLAANALAQSPIHPAAPASSDVAIEEIVVTAQLRKENVQDVPVSVQVISSATLVQQNFHSLDDVSQIAPSVHVAASVSTDELYIRGIGSGSNPSFDQSVGTFIDDIYHGRSRSSAADFFDLERFEILKGPQSTFFGNNAIAGAFNLTTKAPSDSLEGYARALYGMYGDRTVEAASSIPISDQLSARLAIHYDGSDGWLKNESLDSHSPAIDNVAARLTLLYRPSEDLDVKLKLQEGHNQMAGSYLQGNQCPPSAPIPATGFCKVDLGLGLGYTMGSENNFTNGNAGQRTSLSTGEYVLTADYRKWDHTFTLVTGYTDFQYQQRLDIDGTPMALAGLSTPERYQQSSVEFRVASATGQPIEYLAGVYAQFDQLHVGQIFNYAFLSPVFSEVPFLAPLAPLTPLGKDFEFGQTEHSYAAFGSMTWHVTEALRLEAGLRYTEVGKSFNNIDEFGTATAPYGGVVPFPGTLNVLPTPATGLQGLASNLGTGLAGTESGNTHGNALLPSGKVLFNLSPTVMAYFSYAKGFLAGGFNGQDTTGNPSNTRYAPEHVNAYEVGIKSEFFDRRLTLNADVFRSQYTDLQVQQYIDQGGFSVGVVDNAASSTTKGVELEAQWKATDRIRVAANVVYDDAYYGSYRNVSLTQLQTFCHTTANLGNPTCVANFGNNGDPGALQDLSGRPTSNAPRWSGSLDVSDRLNIRDFELTSGITPIVSSGFFPVGPGNDDPLLHQGGYYRLDSRLTLTRVGDKWAIDLIGKNLTDRTIVTALTLWPTSNGSSLRVNEEPRNVALQFRYSW